MPEAEKQTQSAMPRHEVDSDTVAGVCDPKLCSDKGGAKTVLPARSGTLMDLNGAADATRREKSRGIRASVLRAGGGRLYVTSRDAILWPGALGRPCVRRCR